MAQLLLYPSEPVDPTEVTLNQKTASVAVGATKQLSATVLPENADNKNVTWSSSNEGVATVDANGLVTAIAEGTANITAKTVNNLEAKCAVTVNAAK